MGRETVESKRPNARQDGAFAKAKNPEDDYLRALYSSKQFKLNAKLVCEVSAHRWQLHLGELQHVESSCGQHQNLIL